MILMLGDSLTEWGNWKQLLGREDIVNKGISGNTSFDILNRLDSVLNTQADLAVLMFGINDLFWGHRVSEIFLNYQKIIEYIEKKINKIAVQSTIYLATDENESERINKKVTKLNEKLFNYTQKNKSMVFFDINNAMSPMGSLEPEYTTDGVHFNEKGYEVWGKKLKQEIGNISRALFKSL